VPLGIALEKEMHKFEVVFKPHRHSADAGVPAVVVVVHADNWASAIDQAIKHGHFPLDHVPATVSVKVVQ
jgi:hypothetical protein